MAGSRRSALAASLAAVGSLLIASAAQAGPVHRALARADAPVTELSPRATIAVPGGGEIRRYAQRTGGLPVLDAQAVVVVPPESSPVLVADTTAEVGPRDASGAIARAAAIDAARAATGTGRLRAPAEAKLGVDPVSGRLAWEVSLPSAWPLADFLAVVDARTGESLRTRDVLHRATGRAMIFNPNPVVQQGGWNGLRDRRDKDSQLLTSLRLPVTLERITSTRGCLVGIYADARLGTRAKPVCRQSLDFTSLTRSDDAFEAVMAYFHVDRERAYVDSLGLSEPLRSKPQKLRANGIPDDNSYYSSITHSLTLGSGGVDDGEDADVISHEYGHSLQDQASPRFGRSKQGATIGEGFGDYMAAAMSSLTTGPSRFDACIFDWDGISYSLGRCGRSADRSLDLKQAQRRCRFEIHCVGEVWSSTLLELRNSLGADSHGMSIADRVVLESNFMLAPRSGFKDAARALLAADRTLYRGAHVPAIEATLIERKFCRASGC